MADSFISGLTAAGALTGDELLELSQLSTTVTITAATISADGDDNSYNDSGSGFVAAGFAVGDRVRVQGFAGDPANNIFVGVITALTTAKMTIGGTDGDVIVDEAAGASITISKWISRRTSIDDIVTLVSTSTDTAAVVEDDAGTTYDVDNADKGKYLRFTDAGTKTINVRDNADHALDANAEWHFRNVGAGDMTFVEDTAVTINPPTDGTLVVPQGGTVTLKRVAEDFFDLFGVTVPA